MDAIFHRTSIRKYEKREVEQEKVEKILRAAMAAPSAANQQPWEFYVVTDKDVLKALSECSPYAGCTKDAPMAFVVCTRVNCTIPVYAQIDASASVENLLLEADALGLGAVWLGVAPEKERMDKVAEILDMPASLQAFAIVPCGYPAEMRAQQDRYEEERVHYV